MARHGITAKLVINGKHLGVKDITLDISGNEIEISSRGADYKRYLRGLKNFTIETSVELGTETAGEVLAAYDSGDPVNVALHGAATKYGLGGIVVSAPMVVLNAAPEYPTEGEAVLSVKLGLDALEEQTPTINAQNV